MLCSSFLVYGELSYLFFDFRRNSSTKMVNNSQMWMVILIAFLLLFCLDVKVSQMEKRNAQLNTQCDISVFTETERGKQDKSFQKINPKRCGFFGQLRRRGDQSVPFSNNGLWWSQFLFKLHK